MKTIFTIILALLFISTVCIAQDTLYIYKGGAVVSMRAVADIDSITFYKSGNYATDIDGNVYKTVKIGNQIWMAENLKTTKCNNGTPIPLLTNTAEWLESITPGYCWYNNDSATNATYGALYNVYSVFTDSLCPAGWHVPTNAEWNILTDYLGGKEIAGGKLKESGFAHWNAPNLDATNEAGFTALPGGARDINGFGWIGDYGVWWSSTGNTSSAWDLLMGYNLSDASSNNILPYNGHIRYGLSVRCLKNE